MNLRAAVALDLSIVLSWLDNERSFRVWAGPKVQYPALPQNIWSELEASAENTYTFVDSEGVVIGFGQILLQANNVLHLARLIVNPEFRAQGIGRSLCVALMNIGVSEYQPEYFTLNVYDTNRAAMGLYESLGFSVTSEDSGIIAMVKPLTSVGKGRS